MRRTIIRVLCIVEHKEERSAIVKVVDNEFGSEARSDRDE